MNEKLTKLLEGEISREFEELERLESGSKEQTAAVNNVIKLYQLTIDQTKAQAEIKRAVSEHRLALKKQKEEYDLKTKQYELDSLKRTDEVNNSSVEAAKQKRETIFKWCIGVTEIVLPLMFYAVWMKRGFEFERTGTYTSTTFRGLFNNFKPVKK